MPARIWRTGTRTADTADSAPAAFSVQASSFQLPLLDFFFRTFRLLGRFLLGCGQHLADGGPLLLGERFGCELPERLFQIVRILGLEDHDVVGRLGGLVLA